ncbi:FKBP-type peptidyl-prolyl cis-trans isomerase FklB [Aeromonas sp. RU39B]|jgi:FKBP-type peptidyl-prolyl cis-trans isomerase FklB|uniref:FKBP-type peptidyl-prolyl cis-trans isomerase n=1 Tax=Aeromonas sp. RU39B TaxID=1907416 RepID=UPI00095612F7|nr:FKBP-type peptidyl-prolyl cis-trans isomerase [Aeromonas sp. RU39B]SIQ82649.1 FKBP-type peptidyl-prolyl cis-trans isomerase FklB [Aeromonas sp. RU39B]
MSQYESIEQKASYGVGRNMGDQLAQQAFSGLDIAALQQGLADALNGVEFAVSRDDINDAFQVITERMQAEQEAVAKAAAADGEAFLADNAKRDGVSVTDSGLQYEVITAGNGATPVAGQSVRVHYHGTFTDGRVFDSSVSRGQPAEFPVTGVIKGWVEALQLMPVGSKWKLYIPQDLAYGARGAGSIPPYSALVFEVELLDIL